MESNEGMKMLPMRRLNLQVQSVLIEVAPFAPPFSINNLAARSSTHSCPINQFLMDKHVAQAIGSVAHANPSSIDEVAAAMVRHACIPQVMWLEWPLMVVG